ncbi:MULTISPECIES: DUF2892 domain-containing protein [Geodermatophilaceae]|uniref:DUF2892 domain-containing protein n=2 Tax=Geodermatophilaceae TaxID=85030 RepID=A0A285VGB6_9ACTN|nr:MULTISPECIES: DUF2892 domain-containing protein [Geodermatophilaceae]SOC53013.1 Protein of unknown function [Blastococcus aggregatus]
MRTHTPQRLTRRLDDERLARIAEFGTAPRERSSRHLSQLDREWDVERKLEANAATLMLVGVALAATRSKRWLALAGVVPAFLLQHAIQGWCPPIAAFRALGSRSRNEIDAERTAIKALRGDFAGLELEPGAAERALAAAGAR